MNDQLETDDRICSTCKYEFDIEKVGCLKYNPDGNCKDWKADSTHKGTDNETKNGDRS